jgi:hypothetical protein
MKTTIRSMLPYFDLWILVFVGVCGCMMCGSARTP